MPPKDHWNQHDYSLSAPFVPQLTSKVIKWLDPKPEDTILDLGCGDGVLTAKIKSQCAHVDGLDASTNMIEAAMRDYGHVKGLSWYVQDGRHLEQSPTFTAATYNKVFSNAALHWVLNDPTTRLSVMRAVYKLLRPGGSFVFEMGGAGNVAEVHTALLAALAHQGVSIDKAREACPWFFPSEILMADMLSSIGFTVEKSEVEYRPTKLTADKDGGLEGWVRLMGAQFLEVLDCDDRRDATVKEIRDVLQTVLTHGEDGSMWLGYVRLRVEARKPTQ